MPLLAGWSKVPGRRRYISPAGEEVSRRQYYNVKALQAGATSYSQYERARKLDSFQRWARIYERETGTKPTLDSEFTRRYLRVAFNPDGKLKTPGEVDISPEGEFAQLLEFIGIRPSGARWPVGETDGVRE